MTVRNSLTNNQGQLRFGPSSAHAGLWLDKYLKTSNQDNNDAKHNLVSGVCSINEPAEYRGFFRRWENSLRTVNDKLPTAKTTTPLIVGLGAESILETSISLHPTYGVPYIPGSALKGLTAHYAHKFLADEKWRKGNEAHNIAFGNTDSAGYITFYDALPYPGKYKLSPDIITVHHPEYYQNKNQPPADWDSPTPIPFLNVITNSEFLIALSGPEDWRTKVFEILELALENEGIGAKTSSSYGRMEILNSPKKQAQEKGKLADEILLPLKNAGKNQQKIFQKAHTVVEKIQALPEENKKSAAKKALEIIEKAKLKKLNGRDWYETLLKLSGENKT